MKQAVLFIAILFSASYCEGQTTRANRISRPCPNSTTPARVDVGSGTGRPITIAPCSIGEITITSGNGRNNTEFAEAGATGGEITVLTGNGGVTTIAGESGSGGDLRLQTGVGGASTVAAGNTSGVGGSLRISGGAGGGRTGASGNAGRGGHLFIDAGTGGGASGGASAGTGGNVNIDAGATGSTGVAGDPGNINIGTRRRAAEINIGSFAGSYVKLGGTATTQSNIEFLFDDRSGEIFFQGSSVEFRTGMTVSSGANLIFAGGSTGVALDRTITAIGTTGAQTINKMAGTVNIAAATGAAGVTVTNSLVTANSLVFAIARTNDATCSVKSVVPGAGSFVVFTTANCTATTSFGFFVTN